MSHDVKKRINITLEPTLHAWAKAQTGDFSNYVSRLIQDDRDKAEGSMRLTQKDIDALPNPIAKSVLKGLANKRRAQSVARNAKRTK